MDVSVIIPAYNAARTLAQALDSLLAQTFSAWEAIVVDDGSTDETRAVGAGFAARDPRIRLISQAQKGESGARNTGIDLARHDWLLFLDADDWLLPRFLEQSAARLEADCNLDAAVCGWARVAPDGRLGDDKYCPQPDDVFELSTRCCPFAIHACVVRRSLVQSAGGFDPTLVTCADWDLWQRVARLGARFGTITEALARYRMRSDSAGVNGPQLLRDGLRVIERGHSPDPRLRHPVSQFAEGASRELLPAAQYHYCCWPAGLVIGGGQDASPLLESIDRQESGLDPHQMALILFESALLPACRLPSDWPDVWPAHEALIDRFLRALEAKSLAPGIAVRTRRALERLALNAAPNRKPLLVGRTYRINLELTEPIPDISPPPSAERLVCELEVEGEKLGSVELPVCDGFVPAYVLADAVAGRFAWPILGRFWRRTLYAGLQVRRDASGVSIWKEGACLGNGLPEDEESFWPKAHDRIGWRIFSDQLWNISEEAPPQVVENRPFLAEAAAALSSLAVAGEQLACVPLVGGVPLGLVTVPVKQGRVPAEQLRSALLQAVGFEPCRIAVREGVIGRPLQSTPASLWERLKSAAGQTRREAGPNGSPQSLFPAALSGALRPDENSMIVLGPRLSDPIATSASRRAMLPVEAAPEILQAVTGRQDVFCLTREGEPAARLIYAPDLAPVDSVRKPLPDSALRGRKANEAPSLLDRLTSRLTARSRESVVTDRLPILMYHRVAPEGDPRTSRYRVTPEAFREQLRYLREAGYHSVTLEDWRLAMKDERPLPGRAVMLTFDDGYWDFETYAWPLLRRHGFRATLFVVADDVGKTNRWDQARGDQVRLLDWTELRRLQSHGIEVASHSATHPPMSGLTPVEVVREAARSRAILERELDRPVRAFAYPYGIHDEAVQHLVGACGYVFGLSCDFKLSGFFDPLLALPRIEITGSDTLENFAKKIGLR